MKSSSIGKIVSLLMCGVMLAGIPVSAAPTLAERLEYKDYEDFSDIIFDTNYYSDYHSAHEGEYPPEDAEIPIDIFSFKETGKSPERTNDAQKGSVLAWRDDTEKLSYTFNVEYSGFYNLNFSYYPIDGNSLNISRGVRIDGEYPFDGSSSFVLYRRFVDSDKPKENNLGDDLMPQQEEVKAWFTEKVWDNQGISNTPLEFYLTAGAHTVTFEFIDQPMLISEISFTAAKELADYKAVLEQYKADGATEATETIRFEAEDIEHIVGKNSSSILIASDSDETLTPKSTVKKKYNYIGGSTWATGGDTITWDFTVKQTGLYKIALRSVQSANNGIPVYRTIELDGEIPFAQMAGYTLEYNGRWNTHTIGDGEEPYLFYLTKGKHTLKMTAVLGEKAKITQKIEEVNSKLQTCYQNIVMVTGQSPDLNYDYELDKSIVGLGDDLQEVVDLLEECRSMLSEICNKTSTLENSIIQVKSTIEKYRNDFDAIPSGLDDFTSSMTSMGDWLSTLKTSSLAIDYIQIAAPSEELDDPKQSILNRVINAFRNLILSYTKDYNAIGSVGEGAGEDAKQLKVWISRGKEWAEILKELADSEFALENNVDLNFNLLPEGAFSGTVNTLLLAVNAGNSPDVVLNMTSTNTAEYAVRGVIKDLAEFDDFEDYSSYTLSELYKPISYNGSVYGLPESMGFTVMFYRSDMFERLHFTVPDTWDDVYNVLLPKLNQYNLNMYIPQKFEMFLYQNGGEYYSKDGKTSALSSEDAYNAFERFINNYTEYGFPYSVSFYNRFRTGELVIGIGGMTEYMQIAYAAPELSGKWAIAPIPATASDDGTLDRSVGTALESVSVIMKDTEAPDTAWEFLKWWMSTDTQSEYGKRIESRLGISARWGTANYDAFCSLAWSANDISVIKKSLNGVREAPYVPGSYFTARHLNNAISRCLTGGYAPRDSLEEAVEQINIELERKRRDFGIEE
ncbi:MAG: extracellular solute-binding protein [Acutalibacteraceae bacterium]